MSSTWGFMLNVFLVWLFFCTLMTLLHAREQQKEMWMHYVNRAPHLGTTPVKYFVGAQLWGFFFYCVRTLPIPIILCVVIAFYN